MLTEQRNELQKLIDQLWCQDKDMKREYEDTHKKLQSVEKETESDRAKGYLGLKEIILEARQQLRERKQKHEELQLKTQTLLKKTDLLIYEMTEKKTEVEKHKVEISVQLEIEEQMDGIHVEHPLEQKEKNLIH